MGAHDQDAGGDPAASPGRGRKKGQKGAATDTAMGRRFEQAMQGRSKRELERQLGITQATLRSYENGAVPRIDVARTVAEATNVRFLWLATGDGPMTAGEDEELVAPPRGSAWDPRAPGWRIVSEQLVDDVQLRRGLLRERLHRPDATPLLVKVVDDAMRPTVGAGDLVLADPSTPRTRGDGLYLLATPHALTVRRLATHTNRPQAIPDNPAYPSHTLDPEQVVGAVVLIMGGA